MSAAELLALQATVTAAFRTALLELDPRVLVRAALPPRPPRNARVRVIAAGKAAVAMAAGALDRWPDAELDALIVTVAGAPDAVGATRFAGAATADVRVLRAGHPLPDASSLLAADEALARAASLGERDVLLALISGGASALLAAPAAGVTLEEKRELCSALLDRGAPIADVNLVRRHLSRVKGGGLIEAARGARVLSVILSDITGGAAHDVGSGPSVFDPTTVAEASAALERWLPDRHASFAPRLVESRKPAFPLRARWSICADPDALAAAVAGALARSGLATRALAADSGDAAAVVSRRLDQARRLAPGEAVVVPCEPTLVLPPSRGRGGRAGHVALRCALELPPDVVLLCGASDGNDGTGETAGAAVTREAAERLGPEEIAEALASFDDAQAHARMGTALPGAPTGNNLTDVHVLARAR